MNNKDSKKLLAVTLTIALLLFINSNYNKVVYKKEDEFDLDKQEIEEVLKRVKGKGEL